VSKSSIYNKAVDEEGVLGSWDCYGDFRVFGLVQWIAQLQRLTDDTLGELGFLLWIVWAIRFDIIIYI